MKVTGSLELDESEVKTAVIEYLQRRGLKPVQVWLQRKGGHSDAIIATANLEGDVSRFQSYDSVKE